MDGATVDLYRSVETQDKDLYVRALVALTKAKLLRHLADEVTETGWLPGKGDHTLTVQNEDGTRSHILRITVPDCDRCLSKNS